MPIRRSLLLLALLAPVLTRAQPAPEVVPLWTNGAPGFEKLKDVPEEAKDYWVRSINNPSVTVFRPPSGKANGCAVVIAPGGGFRELVFNAEGRQPAEFLNGLGVTAFALKYRLFKQQGSPYRQSDTLLDAHRALRLVRSRAAEFGIDPNRVGMLGFSAGGTLVYLTAFDPGAGDPAAADPVDRLSGRPNFEMIVYPGGSPSMPKAVPAGTGPAFLLAANDDEYGCDQVALTLLEMFRAAKLSVEAHFIAQGKHAFNMGDRSTYAAVNHWPDRMADWLKDRGLLRPTAASARSP
ncbi:MAG TPA: alpha/beta hydrolase [Opitutaceae bacterium]|jgi:acetyl esterase/lipase